MNEKELVRKFYEEIVSGNRFDEVGDYVSPDCVVCLGDDTVPIGVDGMIEHLKATKATYPNYTMKIIRQYQENDTVISEFVMTGTHKGVFLGITPTGKVISIFGVDIDRLEGGKIVSHGGAANTFEAFWENQLIKPV